VSSYDPKSGNILWSTPGTTMATCGTMVWTDDLVIASGGFPKAETIAVKADGSGDVVWKTRHKCYEQSLIVHEGHVYFVTDSGIGICIRARDGELMWQERLKGPVSSSPVRVGDVIYQTIEDGTTFVFKANPEKFELLAQNKLGDEGFPTMAICGNRIYIRTAKPEKGGRQEYLYCLGFKD
jgi:outer membrane protein assembly factor BamB